MIQSLIDKQDNFEIIRDKIADILKTESESQQQLATDGGKDPALWKLRIFTERANAIEVFLNTPVTDKSPIVNVWFDSESADQGASNTTQRQKVSGIFNIDCYGYAEAEDNPSGGHKPGDEEAAFAVQRAIRLVRNILMAGEYTYLDLRKTVWKRWPQSINVFQPQQGNKAIQQVQGARLALSVDFNEFSPQFEAETLELVTTTTFRAEDGEILVEADFEYPLNP